MKLKAFIFLSTLVYALAFAGIIGGGVFLLLLLISAIFFCGIMRVKVKIDEGGITQTTVRHRGLGAGSLDIFAGMAGGVSRGATAAGAGLVGFANRSESIRFSKIQAVASLGRLSKTIPTSSGLPSTEW